ncbi:hypothetical protein GGX14DRAFT_398336 [Mycena pura]|uniref:Uncharacterized protein n=1 Tax=Mycena pura TaxID=153505 RepID=A0AAD6VAZ6_9AGAR|nr:hypothetical protein GGX14DRAFT_398336 [Mycena pura]
MSLLRVVENALVVTSARSGRGYPVKQKVSVSSGSVRGEAPREGLEGEEACGECSVHVVVTVESELEPACGRGGGRSGSSPSPLEPDSSAEKLGDEGVHGSVAVLRAMGRSYPIVQSRKDLAAARQAFEQLDPQSFPVLKEIQLDDIKWPTSEQQARKDQWVAISEVLHRKGIKVIDASGVGGPTGARAKVSTRRQTKSWNGKRPASFRNALSNSSSEVLRTGTFEDVVKSAAASMSTAAVLFILTMLANLEAQRKARHEIDTTVYLNFGTRMPYPIPHCVSVENEDRIPAGSLVIGNIYVSLSDPISSGRFTMTKCSLSVHPSNRWPLPSRHQVEALESPGQRYEQGGAILLNHHQCSDGVGPA